MSTACRAPVFLLAGFCLTPAPVFASCTGTAPNFICSGSNTAPLAIAADKAQVTTQPGFGVASPAGEALAISGKGAIGYEDANASGLDSADSSALSVMATGNASGSPGSVTIRSNGALSGAYWGLYAMNYGSGATSVTTTGHVGSQSREAVYVVNNGTDLTLSANSATGANFGLYAANYGSGDTRITASGLVTATTHVGIYGYAGASTTGLSITAADIDAATTGLFAYNYGRGAVAVTTSGQVRAANGHGLYVHNDKLGSDLTVAAAEVTGTRTGITALNFGTGATKVTATGGVTATTGTGMAVRNATTGTSIAVEATDITGAEAGLSVYNHGTGATLITTRGQVTASKGSGIFADNKAAAGALVIEAADVRGTSYGIQSTNAGTGETRITATGLVEGGTAAVLAGASTQDIDIAILGTLRNSAQASDALALKATTSGSGQVRIEQRGLLLGTVTLGGAATTLVNHSGAVWNTAGGINDLGANTLGNLIENREGATIIAAADGAIGPVTTRFDGAGTFLNAGLVQLQNGTAGDRMIIAGDYVGAGGTVSLDTHLGDDSSPTDRLRITGNASGTGTLHILPAGGQGAPTIEGIKVVDIDGASDARFTLRADYSLNGTPVLIAGAYSYTLQKNGVANPADGDWYLRSSLMQPPELAPDPPEPAPFPPPPPPITVRIPPLPLPPVTAQPQPEPERPPEPVSEQPTEPEPEPQEPVSRPTNAPVTPRLPAPPRAIRRVPQPIWQPGAPLYETMPRLALGFMGLPTLQQRVGNRVWQPGGAWGRIDAAFSRAAGGRSTTGAHASQRHWRAEIGADLPGWSGPAGMLTAGISAFYGQSLAEIASPWGRGSNRMAGYGIGATATWYGASGIYADAQARLGLLRTDLGSQTLGRRLARDVAGYGQALSLELGRRVALGDFLLVPQAQLAWTGVRQRRFVDPYGAPVTAGSDRSLQGRLGLALQRDLRWTTASGLARRAAFYAIANLHYAFLAETAVDVAGARLRNREPRLWGGFGLGGTYDLAAEGLSLYGEIEAAAALVQPGRAYRLAGKAGLRLSW
jgi:fibronectin-binding autotransporter adhesin